MLEKSSLEALKNKQNLLAFSGGVDSTALLFLLIKHKIKFDIAIVNYGLREQSKDEILYAQELATRYHLKCYIHNASPIEKNFEAKAREIRYHFFEELIEKYKYENLLTAHHLGDRFEWMLMQFCKGSGCAELAGMTKEQKRDTYMLLRPLLHLDKQELLVYLENEKIKYFVDASNLNEEIKRNSFRHQHSTPLLQKYLSGIKKSFEYIDEDRDFLIPDVKIKSIGDLSYFPSSHNKRADIYRIDKHLKSLGYMPSASERELLKNEITIVVGRKFVVNQERGFICIIPYDKEAVQLPKKFKEECRILKIEPKLRTYLYKNHNAFEALKELLRSI